MDALKLDLSFASPELEQEFQEAHLLRSQRLEKQVGGCAWVGAGMSGKAVQGVPRPGGASCLPSGWSGQATA